MNTLEARMNRRQMISGLALAGVGAALAACSLDRQRSPSVSIAPPNQQAQFGHLLRRAGFGTAPGELAQWQQLGWEGAVDKLINYQSISNQPLEDHLTALKLDLTKAADIQRWWLVRMAETARPLEEKMTLFWHGLLTSGLTKAKAPQMLQQNDFFRQHALDDYGTILKGVTMNPAMMRWLDTATNVVGHANENYSRELMELFTMGPGNYTEQDVRESARAFTGLTLRGQLTSVFVAKRHDSGTKTFLGHTGNFGPDDIIDIILQQPATPTFLARKLVSHFVSDQPQQATVDTIAGVLKQSSYSIKSAVQAIFMLPEFRAQTSYRAIVKSPAEYTAGTLRRLGVKSDAPYLPLATRLMGQDLFNPPNVAGWPGGSAWLNSGTWLARLNFANYVVTGRQRVPLDATTIFAGKDPTSPEEFVDGISALLIDGNLADEQRALLLDFAGPASDFRANQTRWFDEQGRSLIYLVLALPEYHLN